MTNVFFVLYDTDAGTSIKIKGYDKYLEYFRGVILPMGLGTRYLFSECTRQSQIYHYRIVRERPGYIGYVRNTLDNVLRAGKRVKDEEETIP